MPQKAKNKHLYLIGKIKKIETPNFRMNPAELFQYLPEGQKFTIKRVYWLADVKAEAKSGQHAHTDEDEVFIILQGKAEIVLDDNGKGRRAKTLPTNAIIWVPKYVWHGFSGMSKNAVILALSSTNYDSQRKGYIEDYQKFKELKTK